jgi:hypothetical protein
LLAGVAAAALMGVGLGLWARPAMSERQMALPSIEAVRPAVARTLQIVIDDAPAPLGSPIELLPASRAQAQAAPPPEPLAPVRPSVGLLRVQAVEPEPVEARPPPKAARKPEPRPPQKLAAPKPVKLKAPMVAKARPPKLEKVKVVDKPKAKPAVSKVAKADPKPAKTRLAKIDRREKPARIERAQVKRPAKLELARAIERIAAHRAKTAPKPQVARLETKKPRALKPPVMKVAQKARPAPPAPVKALKPAKGAGPLRIAKAQPKPDTAIRDADRQMNRAYSSARAAGVPDWQLRKQQARWEAARASAARVAPWAVHDVYLARIAELHDLTKDAQASGY